MGKYWNKVWRSSALSRSSKNAKELQLTTEEKLDLALQEISHLKMRVALLEHNLEQELAHPPTAETYPHFPAPSTNLYSTKSLPRYLHHNTHRNIPPSPETSPAIISVLKGASVRASVQRHRSLGDHHQI